MIQKFKANLAVLRQEISIPEYILWWAIRICMFFYIKKELRPDRDLIDYILPFIITAGTCAVFLIRMIFPKKTLLGRISYKAQKYISFMIFFGTFIGNYFGLYGVNSETGAIHYDWILHAISGVTITMLGYHLLIAMNGDKSKLSPQICACGSIGFSCLVIIAWEIMEFVGDFSWGDDNQKYDWVLQEFDPFYPILSKTVAGPEQHGVYDTNIDMAFAFFVTIITAVVLFVVLKRREKKAAAAPAETEPTAISA